MAMAAWELPRDPNKLLKQSHSQSADKDPRRILGHELFVSTSYKKMLVAKDFECHKVTNPRISTP